MQVRKVLNFEDSITKHVDIRRALERCGVPYIDHADNAVDGLDMIEAAIAEGKPYDLIVTDMFFPKSKGGYETESGTYVISELKARGINVPVIVCSSIRLVNPDAVGCIHYNPSRNDLDADMREFVDIVKNM
jgi:CheY-like chemotaxis protein